MDDDKEGVDKLFFLVFIDSRYASRVIVIIMMITMTNDNMRMMTLGSGWRACEERQRGGRREWATV